MFYRFLQRSFWLRPASSRTTHSRAVGVVAGIEAVEASTAAPPAWEAVTEVEPSMPVACARHIPSQVVQAVPDMELPADLAVQ